MSMPRPPTARTWPTSMVSAGTPRAWMTRRPTMRVVVPREKKPAVSNILEVELELETLATHREWPGWPGSWAPQREPW
jgi:hypothetical protein